MRAGQYWALQQVNPSTIKQEDLQKADYQPCLCARALAEARGFGPLNVSTAAERFMSVVETHSARLEGTVDDDGTVVQLATVGGAEVSVVRADSEWAVVRKSRPNQASKCVLKRHGAGRRGDMKLWCPHCKHLP